ncbi:MAG: argininosuccinate lyase [Tannerellaceae bacterium]|jgi:argininosuccinate lyase|nr:argininosuccinate lyase [Tannerellaceae bacterium]
MKKLWDKGTPTDPRIAAFTIGNDRDMDLFLAPYDVLGSIAHVIMLHSIGLLSKEELLLLLPALRTLHAQALQGQLLIEEDVEDIHSQVELSLTRQLGEIGKKIHSGRSRNDQVLLDLKLFTRAEIHQVAQLTAALAHTLLQQSDRYKDVLLPGYTHLQIAMPSSFGLWFAAFAESLADDLLLLHAAYAICNRNPLGSAAGYGSSFPLDRQMTTDLLGFESMNYNVVYAQMGRGKMERAAACALAAIAASLSRLACDACLFNSQNFGFISLPERFTTGSSIMPHKKNPDVFELTRAHCNKLQALPSQITLISNNLPSGYFRDMQIIKEIFLPAFEELKDCLHIVTSMMQELTVNQHILQDKLYAPLFSVEEVNRRVIQGIPFRDAYAEVARLFTGEQDARFIPPAGKDLTQRYTHEGSIGNLCNDRIAARLDDVLNTFPFEHVRKAEQLLLAP